MSKLKACPFCGNVYGDGGIQSNNNFWLCGRCGGRLPKKNGWKIFDEETDLYHPVIWNTRPIEDALRAERDAWREDALQLAMAMNDILHHHNPTYGADEQILLEFWDRRGLDKTEAHNALKGGEDNG